MLRIFFWFLLVTEVFLPAFSEASPKGKDRLDYLQIQKVSLVASGSGFLFIAPHTAPQCDITIDGYRFGVLRIPTEQMLQVILKAQQNGQPLHSVFIKPDPSPENLSGSASFSPCLLHELQVQ